MSSVEEPIEAVATGGGEEPISASDKRGRKLADDTVATAKTLSSPASTRAFLHELAPAR
jgi:hypothetical protein